MSTTYDLCQLEHLGGKEQRPIQITIWKRGFVSLLQTAGPGSRSVDSSNDWLLLSPSDPLILLLLQLWLADTRPHCSLLTMP